MTHQGEGEGEGKGKEKGKGKGGGEKEGLGEEREERGDRRKEKDDGERMTSYGAKISELKFRNLNFAKFQGIENKRFEEETTPLSSTTPHFSFFFLPFCEIHYGRTTVF